MVAIYIYSVPACGDFIDQTGIYAAHNFGFINRQGEASLFELARARPRENY